MSDEVWYAVLVAAAVFAGVWAIVSGKRGRHARAEDWLPKHLEDDALVYVERTFRSREHPLMVARVDRAYRSRRGQITLVELKTRAQVRAYLSDVVELSAQRHALSSETGEQVAPVAFVVVESNGVRTPLPVSLLSRDVVQALARRREQLLNGLRTPRFPSHPRLCAGCAYRARCHPGRMPVDGHGFPEAPTRQVLGHRD